MHLLSLMYVNNNNIFININIIRIHRHYYEYINSQSGNIFRTETPTESWDFLSFSSSRT